MNEKIIRFSQQMQIEFDNNIHKGDIFEWDDFNDMITELEYHKSKVFMAIRCKNPYAIKEYLADCANILMAIGNKFNLYDVDTVDLNIAHELNKHNILKTVSVANQQINQTIL